MTQTRSMCLRVEFRSGDVVAGRVLDQDDNDWPFSSWLDLLTLIERLRTSPATERGSDARH